MSSVLSAAFSEAAGGVRAAPLAPGAEEVLARAVEAGRAAWPAIALDPVDFAASLGRLLSRSAAPLQRLGALHAADLWLACACACGAPGASSALERMLAPAVARALTGLRAQPDFADEVRQALREKLLVGRRGAAPAIATYAGDGPLSAWLRIAARRAALNLRARKQPPVASDDEILVARSPLPDPEVQHLKDRYGVEFRRAFLAGLDALTARERLLLRQHYVDGLSGAQIAELQRVAPSTITRALQGARAALQASVRRSLVEQLRLSTSQIDSLAGLLLSNLEVSLPGALRRG